MAKGTKTGGRDFPPGVSGNPGGRPPLPADLREARRLNQAEFERVANKYLAFTYAELLKAQDDAKTPAIDRIVISLIQRTIDTGDSRRVDLLLERLIGIVKTGVEVTNPDADSPEEKARKMTDQELDKRYDEIVRRARKGR